MKGIYITEEGKKELEDMIAELEGKLHRLFPGSFKKGNAYFILKTRRDMYKEILSSAIVLPVEESWTNITDSTLAFHYHQSFPKGVIIQPKS
jgi:hypothetical protein